jgi:glycosyltransferase involved in cell wall biosynthesis
MVESISKVSIIIPVRNAADYLQRCLESIWKQTWESLDVIIINDGSNDQSLRIAEDFVRRDCRIRVLSQENSGASSARNVGIEKCVGNYMTFVDADDFIEPTMIEELMSLAAGCESPLIFCNNDEVWPHGTEERRLFETLREDAFITRELVLHDIIVGSAGLVCGKLFKSEIAKQHGIRFDEGATMCEDQLFFMNVATHCEQFGVVRKPLYHYDRRNDKSTTLSWLSNAIEMHVNSHEKMLHFLAEANLSNEFGGAMLLRLKNIATYCFRNEVSAESPYDLSGKIRKFKAILSYSEVVQSFAAIPAKRTIDKIERFLVMRRMETTLFLFSWMRATRLTLRRNKRKARIQ